MIKIPSKFIDHYGRNEKRDIYVNIFNVALIDVTRRIDEIWDSKEKKMTGEFEVVNTVSIQLLNGNYIPLAPMNGLLFQEFILWFNKNMAIEKLSKEFSNV